MIRTLCIVLCCITTATGCRETCITVVQEPASGPAETSCVPRPPDCEGFAASVCDDGVCAAAVAGFCDDGLEVVGCSESSDPLGTTSIITCGPPTSS